MRCLTTENFMNTMICLIGQKLSIFIFMTDVTKRKSVGRALKQSQESCLSLTEQSAEQFKICRKQNLSAESMHAGVTVLIRVTDITQFNEKHVWETITFSASKSEGSSAPFWCQQGAVTVSPLRSTHFNFTQQSRRHIYAYNIR